MVRTNITRRLWCGAIALIILWLAGPAKSWSQESSTPSLNEVVNKLENLQMMVDNLQTDVRNLQNTLKGVSTTMNQQGGMQSWDKKLNAANGGPDGCNSDRFTCLWPDANGAFSVVRDNETGLLWERMPESAFTTFSWNGALVHCAKREVGGRKGWHLPMRDQLASLVDTVGMGVDELGNPVKLPDGHPFLNVFSYRYWTASTMAIYPKFAWYINFFDGDGNGLSKNSETHLPAWCVRSGQSFDGQDVGELLNRLLP